MLGYPIGTRAVCPLACYVDWRFAQRHALGLRHQHWYLETIRRQWLKSRVRATPAFQLHSPITEYVGLRSCSYSIIGMLEAAVVMGLMASL